MTVRPRTKDFCIKYVICALFVEYNDVLKFLMLFIIFYIRVDSLSLLNIGTCYTKDNSNIFVGMYDDRIDAIILLLYYFMLHPRRARFIIVDIIYVYWYKNFGQFIIFKQSSLTIYMDVVHRRQQQQLLPLDFSNDERNIELQH